MVLLAGPRNACLWVSQRVAWTFKTGLQRYKTMPILGKLFVWGFALFNVAVLSTLVVIGPEKIAQTLYDLSQALANLRFGWMILGAIMIITSFPPLIGYTTTVTLCGFAYGVKGFLLAGPATMVGATVVFIVLRLLFRKRVRAWTSQNEKWQALETVIRARGLPLIILIRICPFPPWVYANAGFSSIEAVTLWQFFVATTFVLPKIFLAVFIGSRIALFSDGKQRGQMDSTTKLLNVLSIVIGVLLAVITGVILYRLMQRQIKELRESPELVDELAADALEEAEGAPLLQNASSDSLDIESSR